MIERISQSFIKDLVAYNEENECGYLIEQKWVHDRLIENPDEEKGTKELGAYFEFMAFGTLPRNGKIPLPELQSNGKPTAPYRLAAINAGRAAKLIDDWGLKIIKKGWHLTKGRYTGTIDLMCECTKEIHFESGVVWRVGDIIVIDVKYSGLVGDRIPAFNKHGWKWSAAQRKYHGIQAKQYHFLTGAPFYFLVIQSNNPEGTTSLMNMFYISVDSFMVDQHIIEGNAYFNQFQTLVKVNGLQPRPAYNKCIKCPLFKECPHRHEYPQPVPIDLNEDVYGR